MAAFGNLKKHLRKSTAATVVMLTFKIVIIQGPLFFLTSYLLVPKIQICLKYFWDTNPQKQSLWSNTI